MRKTPIGNVTLLYKLDGSTRNWRNNLIPAYYKCSEDKSGQLSTIRPYQLFLIFQQSCSFIPHLPYQRQGGLRASSSVVYLIDLTDI